jgi:hypothetical protein
MDPSTLLMKLLVGGILGLAGQGARAIVGLKKVNDTAQQEGTTFSAEFRLSTLLISFMIGFVAGIVAVISIDMPEDDLIDKTTILAIFAAGYAGTDFIEGFIKKEVVNSPARNAPPNPPPAARGGTAAPPDQTAGT